MERFLVGKRISLHGLTPDQMTPDTPYYGWLDDLSLDEYTERSHFPNNPQRMLDYYTTACANRSLVLLGIFDNESGDHVGNISFSDINWLNRRAFIGYLLGDANYAGKGYVTEACLMMMYYGFNRLNLNRIWGGVSALHGASRKVCAKVGLKEEGIQRQTLLRNGEFSDSIMVGALRDEWMPEFGEKARGFFAVPPTYDMP
ncbi:Putative ribosomal N-acetyltransferase YdaF [Tsuneonella dongtanensis]|uniref:Putative ribosomal N-acetyltransferase YdaF n=1 Tax=Tsuneonella dongtanensis TaxID=692370 RepID=A0A1B2AA44_9SPHN|nr:GNAT family protein [Tsuneonella dongtanensis]ANY18948.1 Putative ribosomal N-acetyltransferase YdaF [Tsuneonella dongtanensis]